MRSRYHPIEDGLWDDDKFDAIGDLPEAGFVERALFVYLCANPRQRPSGIYRATDAQLSAGCRLPEDEVRTYLASLALRGLIVRDGSWLYLPGYLKRQALSPRLLGAVESQIKACTSSIILASFASHYPLLHRMLPDGLETLGIPSPDSPQTVQQRSTIHVTNSVSQSSIRAVTEQSSIRPSVGSHGDKMAQVEDGMETLAYHQSRRHTVEYTKRGNGQRIWRCWGVEGKGSGICAEGEIP